MSNYSFELNQNLLEHFQRDPVGYLSDLGITGRFIRNGHQLQANCPFHQDKMPSFSINTHKGLWKCYAGCGQGNLIQLIRRILRS